MHNRLTRSSATMLMVSIVLSLLFVLNYSAAQWQPAPASPPSGNVDAPVHTGNANQNKGENAPDGQGRLSAKQFIAWDRMRSDRYCDASGNNCSQGVNIMQTGTANISPSEDGSYNVSFDTEFPATPSVQVTSKWNRFNASWSENEPTVFWVTNVSTTGFTINWQGPNVSDFPEGQSGVMWIAALNTASGGGVW